MTKSIERDHKQFRDVIGGKIRKELKNHIKVSSFIPMRDKEGKIRIRINTPEIEIPYITYGDPEEGINRGTGKPGDVIGKDSEKGKGHQAGQEEGVGVIVDVDVNELLDIMQEELELPDLKPKNNNNVEESDIKYISISKTGPESLRHNKRTLKEALKRTIASGSKDFVPCPGQNELVRNIVPIRQDKRYRQWDKIYEPISNAVIMFGRDGSASMDQEKCNIISDMAWWTELWIRRFYKKVDVCYFWHDVAAQEVNSEKFYKYRYGGGTTCSSCLKEMAKQFNTRFRPDKYNIYCFYFTDGENYSGDNEIFVKLLEENFNPSIVNLFAITQILSYDYSDSLKKYVDDHFKNKKQSNISTALIGEELAGWKNQDADRNNDIKKAIKTHLGKKVKNFSYS